MSNELAGYCFKVAGYCENLYKTKHLTAQRDKAVEALEFSRIRFQVNKDFVGASKISRVLDELTGAQQ